MAQTIQGKRANGTYQVVTVDDSGYLSLSGQNASSIWSLPYDYVAATYPDAVTEVYTTRVGGSSGSIQQVITVVYTDSSKALLSSVTRS